MKDIRDFLEPDEPLRAGRFTIIYKKYGDKTGYGIARRSPLDKEKPDVGISVARNRAIKALEKKQNGSVPFHPLKG